MQVSVAFNTEVRSEVLEALKRLGFQVVAGSENGVGEVGHVLGSIPDERSDSAKAIEGVRHVISTDDLDRYE